MVETSQGQSFLLLHVENTAKARTLQERSQRKKGIDLIVGGNKCRRHVMRLNAP